MGAFGASRAARAAVVAALLLVIAGCTAPARTDGQFDAKASLTGSATISQLATLQLLVGTVSDDRMPAPTAAVVSRQALEDLAAVRRSFVGVKPPSPASAADKARWQALLDEAARVASSAEDAIEDRDQAALAAAEDQLGEVIDRIDALDQETSS